MKKFAIFAVLAMVFTSFGYMQPASAICGRQNVRFDGNQRAGDDEFLWLNKTNYDRAGGKMGKFEGIPGFECDDEGCTNLSLIEMPAGHCFNGNCNTSAAVYRCSIGGNDKWVNIGTIRDCTEAEMASKGSIGTTYTNVLIANTNQMNATKYVWIGTNHGYICRATSGTPKKTQEQINCENTGGHWILPPYEAAYSCCGGTKNVGMRWDGSKCVPVVPDNNTLQNCLNSRSSAEGKACCYVSSSVANWNGSKCVCRDGTKTFNSTTRQCVGGSTPVIDENKCNCDQNQLAHLATIEVKYELIYKVNMSDTMAFEITNLARKIINNCDEKTCAHLTDIARLNALIREYEGRISQQLQRDADIQAQRDAAIETERTRLRQQTITNATNSIKNTYNQITSMQSGFDVSVWKNAEGNFNTSRLISDSVAGVVLGTAGGLITSNVIKKNQVNNGFEDLSCTVGGQVVAGWDDQFSVGIR